jgi:hypothetical protein
MPRFPFLAPAAPAALSADAGGMLKIVTPDGAGALASLQAEGEAVVSDRPPGRFQPGLRRPDAPDSAGAGDN